MEGTGGGCGGKLQGDSPFSAPSGFPTCLSTRRCPALSISANMLVRESIWTSMLEEQGGPWSREGPCGEGEERLVFSRERVKGAHQLHIMAAVSLPHPDSFLCNSNPYCSSSPGRSSTGVASHTSPPACHSVLKGKGVSPGSGPAQLAGAFPELTAPPPC